MEYAIVIITRGRPDKQITLKNLPPRVRKTVYLVIDEDEKKEHLQYKNQVHRIEEMPRKHPNHKFNGNAWDKKDWIARKLYDEGIRYIFFLDDDMKFFIRRNEKLRKAKSLETRRIFLILFEIMKIEEFVHVALSPVEGNNRESAPYKDNARAYRFCGFDLEAVFENNLEFNRIILMSDFDMTLSLLELGYPNRVVYAYANGTPGSNKKGGCSIYRTPETMKIAANELKRLHPYFVKVEEKMTKKPWAGFKTNKRTDVRIFWKKAYLFGKDRKNGLRKKLQNMIE